MKNKSMTFILIFIYSIIFKPSSQILNGIELNKVEFYNCNIPVSPSDDVLAGDVMRALKESFRKSKECLPKNLYDKLLNSLKNRTLKIFIDCRPNCDCFMRSDGCGGTPQPKGKPVGFFIMLHFENIYMNSQCGCVEAVILHELLHWGAGLSDSYKDEKKSYGCEEKCFPDCAKDRKGVEPEDCCDK